MLIELGELQEGKATGVEWTRERVIEVQVEKSAEGPFV